MSSAGRVQEKPFSATSRHLDGWSFALPFIHGLMNKVQLNLSRFVIFYFDFDSVAPIAWRQAGQALRHAMKLCVRPETRFKGGLRKRALVATAI